MLQKFHLNLVPDLLNHINSNFFELMKNIIKTCSILNLILFSLLMGCASGKVKNPILTKIDQHTDHRYIAENVMEKIDPLAIALHYGETIKSSQWNEAGVTLVEVFENNDSEYVYEDDESKPLNNGFVTTLSNVNGIGLFIPVTEDQDLVEFRVSYFCPFGRHIAVHVVAENPMLL